MGSRELGIAKAVSRIPMAPLLTIPHFPFPIPTMNEANNSTMTPREIVQELDRHIVGQHAAKRAVAIALRNRWRRAQLEPELRNEVMPKNILMIGPTGVGKTEIARRLATLANAPFVKVEATRFTEVGYVGKDVEQIIRDLADTAVKLYREQAKTRVRTQAEERAEDRLLDALLPKRSGGIGFDPAVVSSEPSAQDSDTPRQVPQNAAQGRTGRQGDRAGAGRQRRRRGHHDPAGDGGNGPAAQADVLQPGRAPRPTSAP